MQFLHSADAGQAFRLAATRDVRGAFNIAADPVMDAAELADVLGARTVRVPERGGGPRSPPRGACTWCLASPGLFDLAMQIPVMDTSRASPSSGGRPSTVPARRSPSSWRACGGAGRDTPPLAPGTGGPARAREFATGVGRRP